MALDVLGTKRQAPADGTVNAERKVPSNKRSRHSPSEHAENAKRHCSGTRRTLYCPEPLLANAREGRQYKRAKEPDAEAKAPLLDSRLATEIEDEEDESEDDDSADSDSGFDDEEDEKEDGDDEPYKADAVPEWTFVNAGVKQFASDLEENQISEQSDGFEEEELEDELEEESISSVSDDYEYDNAGLAAHYERQSQREHDRLVAKMEARIFEVQKGAEEAAAELSESEVGRPIAAPPDDTGINGQWRLYNEDFLADDAHDHRLYLRTSTPEKPVYDSNWNDAQGIAFEILI